MVDLITDFLEYNDFDEVSPNTWFKSYNYWEITFTLEINQIYITDGNISIYLNLDQTTVKKIQEILDFLKVGLKLQKLKYNE